MTEETEEKRDLDDKRFEVKWTKKGGSETPPPPAVEPLDAGKTESVDELKRQLEAEQERVRDLQDKWHRATADLVNLRKRTEQERGDLEKFASMLLVQELLPVLDNFQRALATVPGNLMMLTWVHGIALIERHMQAILEHQGLAPIEAVGKPFNPHYHEAISEQETTDAAPGTVLREYQTGYTMHGRVIRPSLVEVAKAPQTSAESAPSATPDVSPTATDEATTEHIVNESETENTGP